MSAKKRTRTAREKPGVDEGVKSRTGRPPRLFDEAVQRRVLQAIRLGQSRTRAALYAGVARSTLLDALHRGRIGEPVFTDFADRVKRAEAQFENRALRRITLASKATWQAAAWLLERKDPKRWAMRKELTHNVRDERLAKMTPDEHRVELAKLREEIAAEEKRLAEDAGAGGTLQ